jgi:hypothetical protein
MSERPILFSGPMVRALLEGRKTQTRRIVKGHPHVLPPLNIGCPYGVPGDRLWVRETWHPSDSGPELYAADYDSKERAGVEAWKPSIHMPRRASRITLEVTDVRVERLQDITEDEARAEGCDGKSCPVGNLRAWSASQCRYQFAWLWDEINGSRAAWSDNPYVWAITFRRIQP